MSHDDDLAIWDDDPLVKALRAPGTTAELAGEAEVLAAFRSAVPHRRRRRTVRRLGTGAGTFAIAVALSGGVAAAYTNTLPRQVQSVAHGFLGAVGVPAPLPHSPSAHTAGRRSAAHRPHRHPTVLTTVVVTAAPTASHPAPGATTSRRPAHPSPQPSHSAGLADAGNRSPAASPRPTPTASSPSPARLVPAALRGAVSSQRVPAGSGVTLSGTVTSASGEPVPEEQVVAQSRPAGQGQPWARVGSGSTDSDGAVSIDVPALSRTTRLRLVATHGVHSVPATVVVVPSIAATVSPDGNRYAVTITSSGLQPGDTLIVGRRLRKVVRRLSVDSAGTAAFFVGVPPRHDVTFAVRARPTASHAAATTSFIASTR
jgi:hypothetical protein